jgi:hypothetical protein
LTRSSIYDIMQPDTRQLLRTGFAIFAKGPHTNSGWLALMVAMGCLPMGTLILALGLAKLIGDRRR